MENRNENEIRERLRNIVNNYYNQVVKEMEEIERIGKEKIEIKKKEISKAEDWEKALEDLKNKTQEVLEQHEEVLNRGLKGE